jgi:hypothetical protein
MSPGEMRIGTFFAPPRILYIEKQPIISSLSLLPGRHVTVPKRDSKALAI